jgi:hypothetical protein
VKLYVKFQFSLVIKQIIPKYTLISINKLIRTVIKHKKVNNFQKDQDGFSIVWLAKQEQLKSFLLPWFQFRTFCCLGLLILPLQSKAETGIMYKREDPYHD